MNYHEKQIRSMSSSLPNKSAMTEENEAKNFTVLAGSVMNPPRLTSNDDGSGTASQPKNIINCRRRSESFANYTGQEFFMMSSHSQNSQNESYLLQYGESNHLFYSSDSLQQQQQNDNNGGLFPNSINVDKKIVLYKTEMCRTFEETGICKYGTKCQFAHDPVEVRNIPRHPRYKTEICKTFWQLGNCPYGKRCCFIHTENELKDSKQPMPSVQELSRHMQQQIDLKDDDSTYGPIDDETSIIGTINSQNSSRSSSPSKLAEDLKRTINNIGADSIFKNLNNNRRDISTNSDLNNVDNLAMLIGSNCSLNSRGEDPEFKSKDAKSFDCLMMNYTSSNMMINESSSSSTTKQSYSSTKFSIFDKSPGSRTNEHDIWTKGGSFNNSFLPSFQLFKEDPKATTSLSTASSGTASSNSSNPNNQQILIDMLNLLDSAQ